MDMKASVRLGLAHVRDRHRPGSTDAWLLAPADMPLLDPEIINTLINRHSAARERIHVPTYQARRGHPIVLPWSLAGAVLDESGVAIPPGRGIDALLDRAPVEEVAIQAPAVIEDRDTWADYERLLALSRDPQQEVSQPGE
jgi:molybdenum cofactor cytidylyltransferase